MCLLLWALFHILTPTACSYSGEMFSMPHAAGCAVDEYFSAGQLRCLVCDPDKHLVPSPSGVSCVCNERCKVRKWSLASSPVCEPCQPDEIPTKDGRDCIKCPIGNLLVKGNTSVCSSFDCPINHIRVERTTSGLIKPHIECLPCEQGTEPSATRLQCVPCQLTVRSDLKNRCTCPTEDQQLVDGHCVPSALLKEWPDERETYMVTLNSGRKVHSQLLSKHLRKAVALCKLNNLTACQLVGNLCVLVMYSEDTKASPCSLFRDAKRIPTSTSYLPWLFYGDGDAPTVLSRKKISAKYNLDTSSHMSFLNLTGVYFNWNGEFQRTSSVSGHTLQLCPAPWGSLDTSLRFASWYSHECEVSGQQLLVGRGTELLDLYLHYQEGDEDVLYAIPVLIDNIKTDGKFDNTESDRSQWQMVRRFFLLETIMASDSDSAVPEMVRYASDVSLHVKLQGKEDEGKIFVPYLRLKYKELTKEQILSNQKVHLRFSVDYEMPNSLTHALEVCMGVFSALAVVWSGIRTWSHCKRSGRATIDLLTLAQLVLFSCGNLANVFFLVVFIASVNAFIFFKGQSAIHILLPTSSQEDLIKIYIIVAFVLKVVEIGYLIYSQTSVDLFLIDWERPRARNSIPRTLANGVSMTETQEQQPVSIWRTYFVANEWNEMQTTRKLSLNLHLLLLMAVLKLIGVEHWATSDPDVHTSLPRENIGQHPSFVCRLAVGGLAYLALYFLQWVFMTVVYERFVKNGIQEFVDMCSMANISVFILALENYGFYIHGRSAHGFADTDMENIINQLRREEEDLVGHRGLQPGTEQQTFEMSVPAQLRAYYNKLMTPLSSMPQVIKRFTSKPSSGVRSKVGMESVDRSIQAYHNMNKFLAAFLEHALKDLDYEVREKLFTESLLGIEFTDTSDKGVLYSDNGHSFDNVLFYGNESALMSFDLILFCFLEVCTQDYLLAAVVTALVAYFLVMIRRAGGRKNLAKKTIIDERFFI